MNIELSMNDSSETNAQQPASRDKSFFNIVTNSCGEQDERPFRNVTSFVFLRLTAPSLRSTRSTSDTSKKRPQLRYRNVNLRVPYRYCYRYFNMGTLKIDYRYITILSRSRLPANQKQKDCFDRELWY